MSLEAPATVRGSYEATYARWTPVSSITIADGRGSSRSFGDPIGTDELVLRLQLRDASGDLVMDRRYDHRDLAWGNWYLPDTTVLLGSRDGRADPLLRRGRHAVSLEVVRGTSRFGDSAARFLCSEPAK